MESFANSLRVIEKKTVSQALERILPRALKLAPRNRNFRGPIPIIRESWTLSTRGAVIFQKLGKLIVRDEALYDPRRRVISFTQFCMNEQEFYLPPESSVKVRNIFVALAEIDYTDRQKSASVEKMFPTFQRTNLVAQRDDHLERCVEANAAKKVIGIDTTLGETGEKRIDRG